MQSNSTLSLVHDTNAGSTELLIRYVEGHCTQDVRRTSCLSHFICQYADTRFAFWDTPGQHRMAPLIENMLSRPVLSGAAVVVDVTDMNSLGETKFWKKVVDRSSLRSPLPAILLANKCDLVDQRKISAEALAELAEELVCFAYMEVSALTGQNVKEAFHMLFDKALTV